MDKLVVYVGLPQIRNSILLRSSPDRPDDKSEGRKYRRRSNHIEPRPNRRGFLVSAPSGPRPDPPMDKSGIAQAANTSPLRSGHIFRGLSMDMARIHRLMSDLRLANECEAAAQMDVADAEHALDFAKRKVEAMKDRHKERQEACREISDELAEVVALETMAPLILMIGHERS